MRGSSVSSTARLQHRPPRTCGCPCSVMGMLLTPTSLDASVICRSRTLSTSDQIVATSVVPASPFGGFHEHAMRTISHSSFTWGQLLVCWQGSTSLPTKVCTVCSRCSERACNRLFTMCSDVVSMAGGTVHETPIWPSISGCGLFFAEASMCVGSSFSRYCTLILQFGQTVAASANRPRAYCCCRPTSSSLETVPGSVAFRSSRARRTNRFTTWSCRLIGMCHVSASSPGAACPGGPPGAAGVVPGP
mmetsp:Transcript_3495/g.9327  ORF Transcript_3495/g.9327 Transcript_3495/m.9327 type:complete len:247 (+) Transcript_3495:348-1088(+)